MEKVKIIMDVDTGIDDAIAMCLALGNDKFDVLGFTTTYGNRRIEDTTQNTLKMLELLGRPEIPVARGAEKPMIKDREFPEYSIIHGKDGLGDIKKPLPSPKIKELDISAVEFMSRKLKESDGDITLVPVGPLTNVAALLLAHPELKSKIKQCAIMGGSTMKGNASCVAEANIMADPEAAWIVFNSGVKIMMAGLDATWNGYIGYDELREYKANGNKLSDIICEMCGVYEKFYREKMKNDGLAMHDSLPLAWLIHPELVTSENYYVTVDIDGRHTYGMTVTDVNNTLKKAPNASVAMDVKREEFISLIKDAIANLAKKM